jgi:hypothetical protein
MTEELLIVQFFHLSLVLKRIVHLPVPSESFTRRGRQNAGVFCQPHNAAILRARKRFAFIGATSTTCPRRREYLNPAKEGAEFTFLTNAISLSRTAEPK